MPTQVRSYSKINLGLAIGPPRGDGFHSLSTLYQTLALHDLVTVTARPAERTRIQLTSNDPRVPRDSRNTAWKTVTQVLDRLKLTATVNIRILKNLPIQGGMGAGSANAAAALLALQRELSLDFTRSEQVALASAIGSDVPLFLVGGTVLGSDRGQLVTPIPDVMLGGEGEIPCVIALPDTGVSTPQAFRDWDARFAADKGPLQDQSDCGNLEQLSRAYAFVFQKGDEQAKPDTSGILPDLSQDINPDRPEKQQGLSREQHHTASETSESGSEIDLAENSLLALVRTGIENDFETVVFPQYPFLREIKRQLIGTSDCEGKAVYAALSGSGSALFGLYRSVTDAQAAQQRVEELGIQRHALQQDGVKAIVTSTMPRALYWSNMFAE